MKEWHKVLIGLCLFVALCIWMGWGVDEGATSCESPGTIYGCER